MWRSTWTSNCCQALFPVLLTEAWGVGTTKTNETNECELIKTIHRALSTIVLFLSFPKMSEISTSPSRHCDAPLPDLSLASLRRVYMTFQGDVYKSCP